MRTLPITHKWAVAEYLNAMQSVMASAMLCGMASADMEKEYYIKRIKADTRKMLFYRPMFNVAWMTKKQVQLCELYNAYMEKVNK